ncbi:type I restriction endonuclease subunit R [Acinetobacter sp. YH12131]|uniref:type I restriction endonuclease subunit R n=1 Tax=Acinetobacter sp. YH12131 TaxID=2601115 RepID=UPI0015D2805C|nr:DEAD/DEAH box helicase family protein [Acinetobacter sp. YH12131]
MNMLLSDKAHYESHLEEYIVSKLKAQGWLVGESKNYNTDTALYTEDLIGWIKDTQPEKWDNLFNTNGENTEKTIVSRLVAEIERTDNISVFRKGFKMAGAGTGGIIHLTETAPEDKRNETTIKNYKANRLRVVPQLKYNPTRDFRIDLVFFINGLPMATVEIKTDFNQSIDAAKDQYRQDRKPIDPKTKRKEPLLMSKRGAIVHFALSDSEIYMTTCLDGDNTFFLPFNKGNDGHAGNPPVGEDGEYPVAYFWDYICQPDNWLKIFHDFVYIEKKKKADLTGKYTVQERLIFPRYHQFDAVLKMLNDAKTNGVGLNYLCEHSAGSGKTSTIAWTSHGLIRLRQDDGTAYFNSVIVVTDRTVLDDQLQEAIKQIDHQKGLIATINRENKENGGGTKSKQLENALISGTPIIVVTIQTFPHVMEAILTENSLSDRRYAIIVDEAHTSQTGSTASKLQATLALKSSADLEKLSVEELLAQVQKARGNIKNISHFAFTATPKHSTYMLFGRTKDGKPATDDNLPLPFHLYTMRQAIEEGFILDVLKGYVPYKTAFKLGGEAVDNDQRVESKGARRALARWMSLHATNVTQKVQFIVQHFHHNVAHLLNSQAKAMIVTSSRPAAIRYKLALEKYIQENPEYSQYRVLVAFSGTLNGKTVKHEDDGDDNPVFQFSDDIEFSEKTLNEDNPCADLRDTFDRPEYRLMVVANKFQTGFDQPKLCAMYLDKKIANPVEVVQTLSRLNRTTTGKDQTFIIDFVNDPEWIRTCFKQYDSGAEMYNIQDPNVVYTIKDTLDELELYDEDDLEAFKKAKFKTIRDLTKDAHDHNQHKALYQATDKPTRLFNSKLKNLKEAIDAQEELHQKARKDGNASGQSQAELERKILDVELKKLLNFKNDLLKFGRIYSYIAQIIDFADPELENFAAFSKLVGKRLNGIAAKEVDISGLVLTGYGIFKKKDGETEGDAEGEISTVPVVPITGSGSTDPTPTALFYLQEVIDRISAAFGDISTRYEQAVFINHLAAILRENEVVMAQVENNPKEVALQGNLPTALTNAIIQAMASHQQLSAHALKTDSQAMQNILLALYKMLKDGTTLDVEKMKG